MGIVIVFVCDGVDEENFLCLTEEQIDKLFSVDTQNKQQFLTKFASFKEKCIKEADVVVESESSTPITKNINYAVMFEIFFFKLCLCMHQH